MTICLSQNPGKYQANLAKSGRFGKHFIKLTMKYFWRTGKRKRKKKRLRSVKWHSQCNCFAVTYLRQLQAKSHSSQASSGRLKKETISQTGLGTMQQIRQIWQVFFFCIVLLCSIVAVVRVKETSGVLLKVFFGILSKQCKNNSVIFLYKMLF